MLHVQVPAIIALSPDPGIPGRLTGARCVRKKKKKKKKTI